MATGAPKLHPPSQISQMRPVGKANILKDHIPLQVINAVATLLQTVSIVHLIMQFSKPFANHKIGHSQLEIHPLPFEVVEKTWASVTFEAGDFIMGGRLPGIYIFFHVVTQPTK